MTAKLGVTLSLVIVIMFPFYRAGAKAVDLPVTSIEVCTAEPPHEYATEDRRKSLSICSTGIIVDLQLLKVKDFNQITL